MADFAKPIAPKFFHVPRSAFVANHFCHRCQPELSIMPHMRQIEYGLKVGVPYKNIKCPPSGYTKSGAAARLSVKTLEALIAGAGQ